MKRFFFYLILRDSCHTCSPDACSWRRVSTENRFVPLSKESVDNLSFIICDSALYLIYTRIPVFGLLEKKQRVIVGEYERIHTAHDSVSCSQQMLLLRTGVFNERWGCIMCSGMSWLILHSFKRSFEWRTLKQLTFSSWQMNDSIVKKKREKKDHLFFGFCWHAGVKHHLYRRKSNSLDKHTV